MESLKELKQMKEDNLLTDEEFAQFKEKLIKDEPPPKKAKTDSPGGAEDPMQAAPAPAASVAGYGGAGGQQHPPGSWTCGACNNVNWPMRTHCNRQNCKLPRIQVDATLASQMMNQMAGMPGTVPGMPNVPGMHNGIQDWQQNYASLMAPSASATTWAMNPRPQSNREVPAGSWHCPACGNINWPSRTHCNRKECAQPRPAEAIIMSGQGSENPPGSWTCDSCQNVNWPLRQYCNNKNCRKPRNTNGLPTPTSPAESQAAAAAAAAAAMLVGGAAAASTVGM